MTVAVGTINGLIFYSNIISASGVLHLSVKPFFKIFIAWINLDFGFDICFFTGLDMYIKVWLQFIFPLYIWSLVCLILFLSYKSKRVMKLFGRKIISVLATLFLLSYAKLLKNIISAVRFAEIESGDAENQTAELISNKVWAYDGSLPYLHGQHLPLFVVSVLVLAVLFLPYTVILTFGQWLRSIPLTRGFKWTRSTTFISIMDAYHAPYNNQFRYWTGLLLLLRCAVFVVISLNASNDRFGVNLVAINAATAGILALKASFCYNIYKNKYVNTMENVFFVNLGLTAAALYYCSENKKKMQKILIASLSLTIILFVITITYHTIKQFKNTTSFQKLKVLFKWMVTCIFPKRPTNFKLNECNTDHCTNVTGNFLELRESLLDTQ